MLKLHGEIAVFIFRVGETEVIKLPTMIVVATAADCVIEVIVL
jgi:hypothetical protein